MTHSTTKYYSPYFDHQPSKLVDKTDTCSSFCNMGVISRTSKRSSSSNEYQNVKFKGVIYDEYHLSKTLTRIRDNSAFRSEQGNFFKFTSLEQDRAEDFVLVPITLRFD